MDISKGDVIQLNYKAKNAVFIGALAMVDEVKEGGAVVFVNCLDKGNVYYRAEFNEMFLIGKAVLIPELKEVL